MKKMLSICLCILLAFSAAGCTASPIQSAQTTSTLPPASVGYDAPVSDALLEYATDVALYLPSRDGQKLICQYEQLQLSHNQHSAEAIVRALAAHPGNKDMRPLGNGTVLSLYGQHPVEVANGVCTVNLSASALQLDQNEFYNACLSLAATLCELPDIHAVNVLIADQAVGMDISSVLPLGCITAHPGESLPALWEQLLSRRTPLGESPASMATTASAALYFPLADGSGVIPEAHTLSFPGQTPQQLAVSLLSALSAGAQYTEGVCTMPDIASMLVYAPSASDLESGGRLLTLRFIGDLEQRLQEYEIDTACFIASVTQTLLTFIPAVAAVDIYVGTQPLGTLYHATRGSIPIDQGRVRRGTFAGFQCEQVMLYLRRDDSLAPVLRSVSAASAAAPRTLVRLLMNGVTAAESAVGYRPTIPAGPTEHDILGVTIAGDTLLINLSPRFASTVRQLDAQSEQLLCYSIVHTLCAEKGVRRVVFFFGGAPADKLGGAISWGGEFQFSPGLMHEISR